ncbi:ABC transporter ATP-binding protein [Halomonas sp. THAF12]|uniref:ABC transporter ATP-binding protein n=1 Tax=Halomonas sp. B23F22_10 TaxID=3459515 RepID=UPI00373E872F
MSFTEILSVASIGPFMAMVGDIEQLQGEGWLARSYERSGVATPEDFLFLVGGTVLLVLVMAGLTSMYTTWRLNLYSEFVGAELASRLYRLYMHKPWLYHASGSSSYLTKQVAQESQRVTSGILRPLMEMNAKLVLVFFMSLAMFFYNPMVATVGTAIFVIAYLTLYNTVRRRLAHNGKSISASQNFRYKLMAEGFGGIKDVLLLGRQRLFCTRFDSASMGLARAQGTNQALKHAPRYAMEIVAFGAVISLVLYLLKAHQGNIGSILPVLSIYALAGFKLLPALQQTYSSVSSIRGNLAAFEAIREDLWASQDTGLNHQALHSARDQLGAVPVLVPKRDIVLDDVTFHYPGKSEVALDRFSLTIHANQVIGLVGASGSGKSTAIDLIIGLITPQDGRILIDDTPLDVHNMRAWQNSVGFVSQSIFLADSSIRENIAFGLPPEEIDEKWVERAVELAHLKELIAELPEGLDTRVGERGVQLSGGQQQRIGIARALYHDAQVLILDEATSALDGITERMIMDAIHDFSGTKTIVMVAHRLATVQQCDRIYLLSHGRVVDEGDYASLISSNDVFRRMAQHA